MLSINRSVEFQDTGIIAPETNFKVSQGVQERRIAEGVQSIAQDTVSRPPVTDFSELVTAARHVVFPPQLQDIYGKLMGTSEVSIVDIKV